MNTSLISTKIKHFRKIAGLTQENFSELLGVSTQAVSKWEQGLSYPSCEALPFIADILGVSIDELFGKSTDKEIVFMMDGSTPWHDDNKLRIVIYSGKKIAHQSTYDVNNGNNVVSFSCLDNDFDLKGICSYYCSNERQKALKD